MTEWDVVEIIVCLLGALGIIVPCVVKMTNVTQKNTDAIVGLTTALKDLTKDNKKDHENFRNSINNLNRDVAVLTQKHDADIKLLEEKTGKDL